MVSAAEPCKDSTSSKKQRPWTTLTFLSRLPLARGPSRDQSSDHGRTLAGLLSFFW